MLWTCLPILVVIAIVWSLATVTVGGATGHRFGEPLGPEHPSRRLRDIARRQWHSTHPR